MELFDLLDWYYIGAVNMSAYAVFKVFKNFKYVNEYKPFVVLIIASVIGVGFGYVDWMAKEQESFSLAFRKGFLSYTVAVALYSHLIKYIDKLIARINA